MLRYSVIALNALSEEKKSKQVFQSLVFYAFLSNHEEYKLMQEADTLVYKLLILRAACVFRCLVLQFLQEAHGCFRSSHSISE